MESSAPNPIDIGDQLNFIFHGFYKIETGQKGKKRKERRESTGSTFTPLPTNNKLNLLSNNYLTLSK